MDGCVQKQNISVTSVIPTGESGSPLLLADHPRGRLKKGDPSEDLLVGVMSASFADPKRQSPSVYTNVAYFRKWILDTIEGRSSPSRCVRQPKAEHREQPHLARQQPEPSSSPAQVENPISRTVCLPSSAERASIPQLPVVVSMIYPYSAFLVNHV